jgi:hypothetical protein
MKPQSYIGKTIITDSTLQPDTHDILIQELPSNIRIITPDSFVTTDFDRTRTNLHVDHENKVIKQTYG